MYKGFHIVKRQKNNRTVPFLHSANKNIFVSFLIDNKDERQTRQAN